MSELLAKLTDRLAFNAPFVFFSIASLLVMAVAFFAPGCKVFHVWPAIREWLERHSLRPMRAVMIVGAVSLAVNLIIAAVSGIPVPRVYDEFSYLLAADTFAHGRLTNPPSPFWEHFETLYEIQQPTYASKYPPGLGLFLALGQVLTGHPVVGAWLATSAACAAVCWMLLAWLPRRWALLGGLMMALHPQVILWTHGYWGGEVAMLGGALSLGGFGRLLKQPGACAGGWLATGLGILAISRPFEGFVLGMLIVMVLLVETIRRRHRPAWHSIWTTYLPAVLILLGALMWLGYYNWRVTGNPLRLPYAVHEETYAAHPLFLWLPRKQAPVYHHPEMEAIFRMEVGLAAYEKQVSSLGGFLEGMGEKLTTLVWGAFPLLVLLIPLLCLRKIIRRHRMAQLGLWFIAVLVLAILSETVVNRHYAAPVACLVAFLTVLGIRSLATWRHNGYRTGQALIGVLLISFLASLPITILQVWRANMANESALHRDRLVSQLRKMGGQHLVLVKPPQSIWIFNEADRESSPVLWARDLGADRNRDLMTHYSGRRVWTLDQNRGTAAAQLKESASFEAPSGSDGTVEHRP